MKLSDMNWMQVEKYLESDDRVVVPLGSTEQHAYLSLSVDSILSERVSVDAAEPLGIPVLPPLHFGVTPYFTAFPGTISLRIETYLALITDVLDSLASSGFKRILLVNGHGGNAPAQAQAIEWMVKRPEVTVRFHNWWSAPKTWAKVKEIDPVASHASWMENFPWTRLAGVEMPEDQVPLIDHERLRLLPPKKVRDMIKTGNFGGYFQRADDEMLALWQVAVEETRTLMESGWL
jgi:creatinine amidohydrolase